jgi:hypothetical protein
MSHQAMRANLRKHVPSRWAIAIALVALVWANLALGEDFPGKGDVIYPGFVKNPEPPISVIAPVEVGPDPSPAPTCIPANESCDEP